MEIRRWLYYAVNCALLCYIAAKPFSLNKLIESESSQKEVIHTTLPSKIEESEPAAERFSLNKGLKPLIRISKKFKETGKISPLKYRKTFQIKSPLKPKRVKSSLRTRHKRKNQSIKREIDGNAILNKKYVPLLRSLGMLFGNILGTDSGESIEKTKHKKRLRYYFNEDDGASCKCPRKGEPDSKPASKEETVTFSETVTSEIAVTTEVATETTDNPSAGDLRSLRHHTNVPILLPRNTSGARRNHHGDGERGRAAHNGSAERHLSGNNGDSEHNSKHGQEQTYAESDEKYTDNDPRNNASSTQLRGKVRGRELRNNTEEVYENDAISQDESENFLESRKSTTQYNGAFKLEAKRNKAKSGNFLPELIRKQRRFLSDDKIIDIAESVQSESTESDKESAVDVAYDSSGGQRFADGDGANSAENKKVDSRTETVIHMFQEATNRYSAKSIKAIKTKGLIADHLESDQNDDYNENAANISYDDFELRNFDTNYSKSIEGREPNTRSETNRHEEPVVEKPRDISKKSKVYVINDSVEIVQNGHKVGSMEDESTSDQQVVDNIFSSRNEVDKESDSIDILPEVEDSQHLPKSKPSRGPVVMIIDGYSVTRHKNGENKLAGKAIRIRP